MIVPALLYPAYWLSRKAQLAALVAVHGVCVVLAKLTRRV